MPDGLGFYSRQMPHYVELNRGQMPGGCPGGRWSRLELTDTLVQLYMYGGTSI